MLGLILTLALLLLLAAGFNWWRSYGDPFLGGEHRRDTQVVLGLALVASVIAVVLAVQR